MSLIADKGFRYAGQALIPGDPFTPRNERDARILKAIGKASDAPLPDPLDGLRAEAGAIGLDVDRRWGEERLRKEIETASKSKRGTYQRRDMRAEG